MEKVIFIDVDGTLKSEKMEISKRTIEAIAKVGTIGYKVILCTGRPCDYVNRLNKEIRGGRYLIYNNGGGLYDVLDKLFLHENGMNEESVVRLYDVANKDGVRFILASNGTRYVNWLKHYDGSETLIEEPLVNFLVKNVVVQVTISSPDFDLIKEMRKELEAVSDVKIMNQSKSLIDDNYQVTGATYYDIVDVNTSKGNMVNYFCDLLEISRENRIAIGDDRNDVSMFQACGYNVAVENALPELKEMADYITDSCEQDGVAKFLEKLFEEKL